MLRFGNVILILTIYLNNVRRCSDAITDLSIVVIGLAGCCLWVKGKSITHKSESFGTDYHILIHSFVDVSGPLSTPPER